MKNVAYYVLSHFVLSTFVKDILAIIAKVDITTFGIQPFVDRVITALNDYNKAQQRDMVNPLTAQLHKADDDRDNCFMALITYIDYCKYSLDESIKEAAVLIDKAINRYGDKIYRLGYGSKSAKYLNLLAELRTEPLSQAVSTIGAGNCILALETTQANFDDVIQQRAGDTDVNDFTLRDTRKDVEEEIRTLLVTIENLGKINNSAELKTMLEQIDNIIATTMTSARISYSHKVNNKEDNGTEEPTGQEPNDEVPTDETPTNEEPTDETPANEPAAEEKQVCDAPVAKTQTKDELPEVV